MEGVGRAIRVGTVVRRRQKVEQVEEPSPGCGNGRPQRRIGHLLGADAERPRRHAPVDRGQHVDDENPLLREQRAHLPHEPRGGAQERGRRILLGGRAGQPGGGNQPAKRAAPQDEELVDEGAAGEADRRAARDDPVPGRGESVQAGRSVSGAAVRGTAAADENDLGTEARHFRREFAVDRHELGPDLVLALAEDIVRPNHGARAHPPAQQGQQHQPLLVGVRPHQVQRHDGRARRVAVERPGDLLRVRPAAPVMGIGALRIAEEDDHRPGRQIAQPVQEGAGILPSEGAEVRRRDVASRRRGQHGELALERGQGKRQVSLGRREQQPRDEQVAQQAAPAVRTGSR